nr:MAG TPA: hypothetical protein [Caudoviricetes sp.]
MIIKINVRNKIAMLAAPVAIVCGNSDYSIQFDFDAEWQPYETKTARFIIGGKYTDVVFSGDTVDMPIVYNTRMVAVGVFAGDLRTTTPALIFAHRSILDGTGSPAAPDADVYNAIMQALNDRISEPSPDGTAGQVLATDGRGGRYWTDQTGGGGASEVEIDNKTIVKDADGKLKTAVGGYEEPAEITWDGNTEGHTVVTLDDDFQLCKVSEATPSKAELVGGTVTTTAVATLEITEASISSPLNGALMIGDTEIIIISEALPDEGFAETGTYFLKTNSSYVAGLKYSFVQKIDAKFLSSSVAAKKYIQLKGINAIQDHRWYGDLMNSDIEVVACPTVAEISSAFADGALFVSGKVNSSTSIVPSKVLSMYTAADVVTIIFCVGLPSTYGFSSIQTITFNSSTKTVIDYNATDVGMSTVGVAPLSVAGWKDSYRPVSCADVYNFVDGRIKEDSVILKSTGGTKKFKITVDDNGTLSATAVTS